MRRFQTTGQHVIQTFLDRSMMTLERERMLKVEVAGQSTLFAPVVNHARIKRLQGLHLKIYLSSVGLITSSANTSNNSIGFLFVAGLIEAGTLHEPKSKGYVSTADWYDKIWDHAHGWMTRWHRLVRDYEHRIDVSKGKTFVGMNDNLLRRNAAHLLIIQASS